MACFWHGMKLEPGSQLCEQCLPQGECRDPELCPLARVKPGARVTIRRLEASDATSQRLREIGLGENQTVRLLARSANLICQVCNARLGISLQLAESILVQPFDSVSGPEIA